MLVLQDCIDKLAGFKKTFAQKFGITKLGIFGSVARKENTENSDIDIVVEVEKPSLQLMYELKDLKNENKPLDAYPNIPWNAIYGLRNIISHEYANIDEDIIVSVIKDDLLPLKEAIESLIKKY